MGCGGLVVLGVLALLLAGTGGDRTARDDLAKGEDFPTARIGEPLRVGDLTWVVEDAKVATELASTYDRPLSGNFVVVNFSFTNDGTEAVTLDTASLALIDSEGRKNEADPDKYGYIPEGRNVFIENVNPGVTQRGQAIFTVAPGASGFELEAGDADLFSGDHGRVPLGI